MFTAAIFAKKRRQDYMCKHTHTQIFFPQMKQLNFENKKCSVTWGRREVGGYTHGLYESKFSLNIYCPTV